MRTAALIATFVLVTAGAVPQLTSEGSSWEKSIAPGFSYRMEVDAKTPRLVHVFRINPQSPVIRLQPALAGKTVYELNSSRGRGTLSQIKVEHEALAAINADFFPFTGDPLGLMVLDGKLLSAPERNRAVFAWGPKAAQIAVPTFAASITPEGGKPIVVDGWNQECPVNRITINTFEAGFALAKSPSIAALIRIDEAILGANSVVTGQVEYLIPDPENIQVPKGSILVVANGDKVAEISGLRSGSKVQIQTQVTGLDWEKLDQAIGGGPFLVQDGKIFIDDSDQGFNEAFSQKRHPRTAIGVNANGEIIIAVVDGRQTMSDGATLAEMAQLMQKLGCRNAINLDGGGSSQINLRNLILNRPSDGIERPIANGLVILSSLKEAPTKDKFKLTVPTSIRSRASMRLTVLGKDGTEIPSSEIIWSAMGAAWIDQGGTLTPTKDGKVTVSVSVRGQVLTATLEVALPRLVRTSG